jgi:acetyltransferase-like isoleucine patch superfamily enzyme
VHPSAWVSARCVLSARNGRGSITIGAHCEIHPFSMLLSYGGDIRLGDHCSLNPFAIVYGHGGVTMGDGVRIAAHSVVIPASHNVAGAGVPVHRSGVTARGIRIGDNVWIGAGARILDGTVIGRDVVVGAGSVVTKSIPAGERVAGVPARPISSHRP